MAEIAWLLGNCDFNEEVNKYEKKISAYQHSADELVTAESISDYEAKERRHDLEDIFLNPKFHKRPLCLLPVEGYAQAYYCCALYHLPAQKIIHLFDQIVDKKNTKECEKFFDFASDLETVQRLRKAKLTNNYFDALFTLDEEYKKFVKDRVQKNQEEKIALLTPEQLKQYYRSFVKVFRHLPSLRYDKLPESLGLAMADPIVLMKSVEKYGSKAVARDISEWYRAQIIELDQKINASHRTSIMSRGAVAAAALPTAVFAPNLSLMGRGILGACAAVSGWLAFNQLVKAQKAQKE
ncbi:MAG: hypothetical protein II942_00300, partial [Alphaproteobacteria bacterium]|nr:hypothetical protein [Alphaproteobacteria bacterium]